MSSAVIALRDEIAEDEDMPMGALQIFVASTLAGYLWSFARQHRLGSVVTEMKFRLPAVPAIDRRPDVAFVSYERWPAARPVPSTDAWEVVPDLAIEVISPTNLADEVLRKVSEYFRTGVRLVWVVYTEEQLVYVYSSPTGVRIIDGTGELDGADVVPGFRLALTDLLNGAPMSSSSHPGGCRDRGPQLGPG
jgi:Uma2 family endonuclease